IGVSSSMVNNYIKELYRKGLLVVKGDTNRNMRYELTPLGCERRDRLLVEYSIEIIQRYGTAKMAFVGKLMKFYSDGIERIVFFGAAETCEVVFTAIKKTPMRVVGIVDNDVKKHGINFFDFIITSPEILNHIDFDGIIITTFANQDAIYNQIKYLKKRGIVIKRL
ncbi:MAG: hypothetical protein ABIF87_06695, partial [Pseudomonadota bacterium]